MNDCYVALFNALRGVQVRCHEDGGFEDRLNDIGSALRSILNDLRETSAPNAIVFVFGYPNLVPPDDQGDHDCAALRLDEIRHIVRTRDSASLGGDAISMFKEGLGAMVTSIARAHDSVSTEEREFLRGAATQLNSVIQDEVDYAVRNHNANIHYVPIIDDFEGHYACGDRIERNEDELEQDTQFLKGLVGDPEADEPVPISGRSFHPTIAGHQEYARILIHYINKAIREGATVDPSGLPLAGGTASASGGQEATDRRQRRGVEGGDTASIDGKSSVGSGGATPGVASGGAASGGSGELPAVVTLPLWPRRVELSASSCGILWEPGEQVELFTGEFAPNSTVRMSVVAGTAPRRDGTVAGGLLPTVDIPPATADEEGRLSVIWTLPDAPAAGEDPTPRWYVVTAQGDTAVSGVALEARMINPLIVYPGVLVCAAHDTATTTMGASVRINVLANDVAPSGGAFDLASMEVDAAFGGQFVVDPTDGSVTFTPDPGFVGTARARYTVYDSWNVGARADISVTVQAGCTITGGVPAASGAVVEVVGTDGDDVICVGDRTDRAGALSHRREGWR